MIWQKFLSYINIFGKKQPGAKGNLNLQMMHGINRISIFMFIVAIIVIILRRIL
jgi:hypothetical protein